MGKRGDGEGSVFQRKSTGKWIAQVFTGYSPKGTRLYKTFTCNTQREAEAKKRAALNALDRGEPLTVKKQTVRQFLEHWLEDVVKPLRAPRTYESYRDEIRRNIVPAIGHLPLATLTPQQVQAMLTKLRTSGGKDGQGLSPRTVQYNRAILRKALNQALKWGEVSRNVATLVDPPPARKREWEPLTTEQARAFLAAAKGDPLEALFCTAVSLGLREGEILGLRWEDVDLGRGVLRVRRQRQRVDGRIELRELKTGSSRRNIDLPPVLVAQLRAHRVRQAEARLAAGRRWQDWDLVFPSSIGTPLDPRNLTRLYKRLLERAGLPDMRFHDLRHSCASLLIAQGIPLEVVSRILGHSQISLTMNTYVHLLPGVQKRAADAMEQLFGGQEERAG